MSHSKSDLTLFLETSLLRESQLCARLVNVSTGEGLREERLRRAGETGVTIEERGALPLADNRLSYVCIAS